MSAISTPNDSPASAHIQPLHNPDNAAHIVVPQAPLGNATNGPLKQAVGMGAKALFEKRFAKGNTTYVSPTDSMMTPATQKINAAKKKHFNKSTKPIPGLFQQKDTTVEQGSDEEEGGNVNDGEHNNEQPFAPDTGLTTGSSGALPVDADENPF